MKRLILVLIVAAVFVGLGVYYYKNLDKNYHTLEEFYDFPVPNDVTIENQSEKAKNYIWEQSSGTDVPIRYRLVIRKSGWKEVGIDGHNSIYEKDGKQIIIAVASDYIGIIKMTKD
ncbi:hypothetical protein [Bacillus sp. B-jedd]|uniref:hypothetical protein n=1 Tax=Bacillus sp. B-jedd TaxID=1476857 RepID=UPI0005156529|nr:hypothetical protein [Bacillus sp. B-jedd]CEG27155.1 hypothetical protein BN1002_02011 [Bacillus sp. B-jedd]